MTIITTTTKIETHPNFKSVVPGIKNANDIYNYLRIPLALQDNFDKETTYWEMLNLWNPEHLESFKIKPEKIDRLYHIYSEPTELGYDCGMVVRVIEEGILTLFVDFTCTFFRNDNTWKGGIFINTDSQFFMRLCRWRLVGKEKEDVYNSLKEDYGNTWSIENELLPLDNYYFQLTKKLYNSVII